MANQDKFYNSGLYYFQEELQEINRVFKEAYDQGRIQGDYKQEGQNYIFSHKISPDGYGFKGYFLGLRTYGHFFLAPDLQTNLSWNHRCDIQEFLASPLVPDNLKNYIILHKEFFLREPRNHNEELKLT